MIDVYISSDMNPRTAASVADVLRQPRILIPTEDDYGAERHSSWVERTEAGLIAGSRQAVIAHDMGKACGAVVFRESDFDAEAVDVRNISILPQTRGVKFGSFLLSMAEREARNVYPNANTIYVDTKITNEEMLAFLERQGYEIVRIDQLYTQSQQHDVVLAKNLRLAA